jgi:hypothetical protein
MLASNHSRDIRCIEAQRSAKKPPDAKTLMLHLERILVSGSDGAMAPSKRDEWEGEPTAEDLATEAALDDGCKADLEDIRREIARFKDGWDENRKRAVMTGDVAPVLENLNGKIAFLEKAIAIGESLNEGEPPPELPAMRKMLEETRQLRDVLQRKGTPLA